VPIKTLTGTNVAALLRQAQAVVGPEAIIMHVRRVRTPDGVQFEVTAADPASALTAGRPSPASLESGAELIAPPQPSRGPLVIALVGPTGAGKTTTIAKLASHPRVFGSRRVGVIGLDTFRIGAVEQLRTYAALAGLPTEIVYGEEDLPRVRAALADCDVWLVDTPGRSPRLRHDRTHVDGLVAALGPTEVHLTVPAGMPAHLVRAVLREPRVARITHLLVTKADEAPDESGPVDVAVEGDLPVRWVADGQDVPFDLTGAEAILSGARMAKGRAVADRPPIGVTR
jgi:flagellar biosynthesis protein FlhF